MNQNITMLNCHFYSHKLINNGLRSNLCLYSVMIVNQNWKGDLCYWIFYKLLLNIAFYMKVYSTFLIVGRILKSSTNICTHLY